MRLLTWLDGFPPLFNFFFSDQSHAIYQVYSHLSEGEMQISATSYANLSSTTVVTINFSRAGRSNLQRGSRCRSPCRPILFDLGHGIMTRNWKTHFTTLFFDSTAAASAALPEQLMQLQSLRAHNHQWSWSRTILSLYLLGYSTRKAFSLFSQHLPHHQLKLGSARLWFSRRSHVNRSRRVPRARPISTISLKLKVLFLRQTTKTTATVRVASKQAKEEE